MTPKNVLDAFPDFKGTFMEDLFLALEAVKAGKANDDVKTSVQPNEEVVDETNSFERALIHLQHVYAQTERKIMSRMLQANISGVFGVHPFLDEDKLGKELKSCRDRFKAVTRIMWDSIRTRLANKEKPEATAWGIKHDHKIVLVFDKNDDDHDEMEERFALLELVRELMGK